VELAHCCFSEYQSVQNIPVLPPTKQNQASRVLLLSAEIPEVCQSSVTAYTGSLNAIIYADKPPDCSLAPFWPMLINALLNYSWG